MSDDGMEHRDKRLRISSESSQEPRGNGEWCRANSIPLRRDKFFHANVRSPGCERTYILAASESLVGRDRRMACYLLTPSRCKNLHRMCMRILRKCALFSVVARASVLHIIVMQELAPLFCRWICEETPSCPQIGRLRRSGPLPAAAPVVRAAPIRSSIASIRGPSAVATAAGSRPCPSIWSGITARCRPRSATGRG